MTSLFRIIDSNILLRVIIRDIINLIWIVETALRKLHYGHENLPIEEKPQKRKKPYPSSWSSGTRPPPMSRIICSILAAPRRVSQHLEEAIE
jgi:hypothetical protein